jgi:hypothetical protein
VTFFLGGLYNFEKMGKVGEVNSTTLSELLKTVHAHYVAMYGPTKHPERTQSILGGLGEYPPSGPSGSFVLTLDHTRVYTTNGADGVKDQRHLIGAQYYTISHTFRGWVGCTATYSEALFFALTLED